MKKIPLFVLMFTLLVHNVYCQLKFEQFENFQNIIDKAKREKKLIFIQFESSECAQCFEVAKTGLSGLAAETVYNANFINTSIKIGSKIHNELSIKYNIASIKIGSIYLDSDGFILYKMETTTSNKNTYLENAENALKLVKNNPIKDLEKKYLTDINKNKEILLKLIDENVKYGLNVPNLVDEYFEKLTIAQLKETKNIRLIFENGLALNNLNRKIIYLLHPREQIDSVFNQFPNEKKYKIHQNINISTNEVAIRTKDVNLAYELSNYIYNLWGADYKKGSFSSQAYLASFYKDIKDTTRYYQTVNSFIESQIMRFPLDSLKKMNENDRINFLKNNQQGNYVPFYLNFASELNNKAYAIFEMTKDYEQLGKALKWSKRSIEIFEALYMDQSKKENTSFYDTYACLLYRTNNVKEALLWQKKAIEVSKSRNEPFKNFETTLLKMKEGTL